MTYLSLKTFVTYLSLKTFVTYLSLKTFFTYLSLKTDLDSGSVPLKRRSCSEARAGSQRTSSTWRSRCRIFIFIFRKKMTKTKSRCRTARTTLRCPRSSTPSAREGLGSSRREIFGGSPSSSSSRNPSPSKTASVMKSHQRYHCQLFFDDSLHRSILSPG